jgi:hypothetical protein
VAVVVEVARVAGAQPAVLAERLGGGLLVVEVAPKTAGGAQLDLAVVGDAQLGAGDRLCRRC